ncbi:MAG: hypothetical protein OJF47_000542 [Nitrospira sp.]|nr:MAG: hypothetical protein OJF47_000542 [Nitrospira sp.]
MQGSHLRIPSGTCLAALQGGLSFDCDYTTTDLGSVRTFH